MRRHLFLTTAFMALLSLPFGASATNGYLAHGYGTASKGLAGGGSALPQDSLAAASNPAGMVWVGNRADLGVALFAPIRSYSTEDPINPNFASFWPFNHSDTSDNNLFLVPSFGYNHMLDDRSSVGVSVYGNGGMNTSWSSNPQPSGIVPPGTFYGGGAGVNLMQLFVAPTYSRKITDTSSWGASLILAAQRFSATGLIQASPFQGFVADGIPDDLSDNGADYSYGAGVKLGVQGEVVKGLTLAASYQSRIHMGEFDKYSDLFAEQGDFDIPATATLGLAYAFNDRMTLTFDVQQIWYGDVDSIANPVSNLSGTAAPLTSCLTGNPTYCLGGDNGVGFGWEDMTIYKLGFQWQTGNGWTWRVGYSHGDQPIPDTEAMFNILAPAVVEDHFTFGFTKEMGKSGALNFAMMYAPEETLSGNVPAPFGGDQIDLKMYQYELEMSYTWKF